jgi:hypothetical protein
LFDESTMSSFCERFIRVIESVVADPRWPSRTSTC